MKGALAGLILLISATASVLAQTPYGPYKVDLIDLAGDECLDLVLGYQGAGVVTIERGDCRSGFERNYAINTYVTGDAVGDRHIHNMAFADVDGDGKTDAAFAIGSEAGAIVVTHNTGDGALPQRWSATPPTGTYFKAVALGDFDSDGKIDVAGAARAVDGSSSALLYLWPGLGNFSFGPPTIIPTGSAAYAIDMGDFDGDGNQDFLIPSDASVYAALILNPGSSIFLSPPSFIPVTMPTPPGYLDPRVNDARALDMNADGVLDIVAVSTRGGLVAVFHGKGDGTFYPPQMAQAVEPAVGIADCDMNFDGRPDIAVTTYLGSTATSVLVNGAGGLFPRQVLSTDLGSYGIACADFGGGAAPDIVTANFSSRTINLVNGIWGGLFKPPVSLSRGIVWDGSAWVAE